MTSAPSARTASAVATQLGGLAAVADRDHDVAAHDLAGAAVHGLGAVQEGRGRAGRARTGSRRSARRARACRCPSRARGRPRPRPRGAARRRGRSGGVEPLAQRRELLDRDVEAQRARRHRRGRDARRARFRSTRPACCRRSSASTRARAQAGSSGKAPSFSTQAAPQAFARRAASLPAEARRERHEQPAEEGVARRRWCRARARRGRPARAAPTPSAEIAQPAAPSVTTTASLAEALAHRLGDARARRARLGHERARGRLRGLQRCAPRAAPPRARGVAEAGHGVARRHVEVEQRRDARLVRAAQHLAHRGERQLRDLGRHAQRAADRLRVVRAHVLGRRLRGRARRHVDRAGALVVHVDVGRGARASRRARSRARCRAGPSRRAGSGRPRRPPACRRCRRGSPSTAAQPRWFSTTPPTRTSRGRRPHRRAGCPSRRRRGCGARGAAGRRPCCRCRACAAAGAALMRRAPARGSPSSAGAARAPGAHLVEARIEARGLVGRQRRRPSATASQPITPSRSSERLRQATGRLPPAACVASR